MAADQPLDTLVIVQSHVDIDGIRLHYARRGHGPIKLLCTSGTLGSYDDFTDFLNGINADEFTAVAWDPPGYGRSRPPNRNQAVNRAQKDGGLAIKLMESLQLTPLAALGWSEGSRISIHIAHQAGARCTQLVVWGAGAKVDERGVRMFERLSKVDTWPADQQEPFIKMYGKEYFAAEWKAVSDLIISVHTNFNGIFPSWMVLDRIKQPTLILHGLKDVYANGPTLMEKIKHAVLVTLPEGQHRMHLDEPEWFNKQVTQFLIANNK